MSFTWVHSRDQNVHGEMTHHQWRTCMDSTKHYYYWLMNWLIFIWKKLHGCNFSKLSGSILGKLCSSNKKSLLKKSLFCDLQQFSRLSEFWQRITLRTRSGSISNPHTKSTCNSSSSNGHSNWTLLSKTGTLLIEPIFFLPHSLPRVISGSTTLPKRVQFPGPRSY